MNTASATGVPIHEYHRHGDVDVNQDWWRVIRMEWVERVNS
jgi:hypothetical protein